MTQPARRPVKVGLVQMSCSADPAANLAKVLDRIRQAAAKGARIVSTQELFRSEYFCQREDHDLFALAEPIPALPARRSAPSPRNWAS